MVFCYNKILILRSGVSPTGQADFVGDFTPSDSIPRTNGQVWYYLSRKVVLKLIMLGTSLLIVLEIKLHFFLYFQFWSSVVKKNKKDDTIINHCDFINAVTSQQKCSHDFFIYILKTQCIVLLFSNYQVLYARKYLKCKIASENVIICICAAHAQSRCYCNKHLNYGG